MLVNGFELFFFFYGFQLQLFVRPLNVRVYPSSQINHHIFPVQPNHLILIWLNQLKNDTTLIDLNQLKKDTTVIHQSQLKSHTTLIDLNHTTLIPLNHTTLIDLNQLRNHTTLVPLNHTTLIDLNQLRNHTTLIPLNHTTHILLALPNQQEHSSHHQHSSQVKHPSKQKTLLRQLIPITSCSNQVSTSKTLCGLHLLIISPYLINILLIKLQNTKGTIAARGIE